jgi:RNA polymerase sigma-70 factor, ECF subfamily
MGQASSILYRALPTRHLSRTLPGGRSSSGNAIEQQTALIEAHIPGLRRFAYALLRGDRERADDLVQYCLEHALAGWHRRRLDADLRGWLYTILYNRFLGDHRRERQGRLRHRLSGFAQASLQDAGGRGHSALENPDLLRAFAELPQEQQSVLLLIGVDDFSYEQAARILSVPIATVMSQLSCGREQLRQYMKGERTGIHSSTSTVQ